MICCEPSRGSQEELDSLKWRHDPVIANAAEVLIKGDVLVRATGVYPLLVRNSKSEVRLEESPNRR